MLRERTTGTLERLMTLPLAKLDLLAGYAIAFGLLAAVQATAVCFVGFALLGLDAPHGAVLVALLAICNALLGMALGLLVSAFARTEFQAVQFMPALIFPQLLLCGPVRCPRRDDPAARGAVLGAAATYAYDALARDRRRSTGIAAPCRRARRRRRRFGCASARRAHTAPTNGLTIVRSRCVGGPVSGRSRLNAPARTAARTARDAGHRGTRQ